MGVGEGRGARGRGGSSNDLVYYIFDLLYALVVVCYSSVGQLA